MLPPVMSPSRERPPLRVGLVQLEPAELELLVKLAALASFLGALYALGVIRRSHLREIRSTLIAVMRSREST